MLSTIIIEDEQLSAEKLHLLLSKVRKDIQVEAILSSVSESVKWLKNNKADLIFMDIHLSDGKALEIFQKLKVETPVIFTTAYDQYVLEAFKESGIDYLMKPIVTKDLERALNKFSYLRGDAYNIEVLDVFLTKLRNEGQKNFLVNSGKEIKIIPSQEISYFYAEDRSVYLVNSQGRKFLFNETLEKVHTNLPKFFCRVNRKVIVNLNQISSIENYTYGRLLITIDPKPGFDVIIPLERVNGFKNSIKNNR